MEIKKVAILTFHYAHNYGAVLQALALKKYLEYMNLDVEIINYRNKKVDDVYKGKLGWRPRRKWLNPRYWTEILKQFKFIRYASFDWERRQKSFEEFISDVVIRRSKVVSFDELSDLKVDAFIVGSDQVWNKGITGGLDKGYLLDFKTPARKVSYAASMGSWDFSHKEVMYLKRCLEDFDAVSVREQQIAWKLNEYSKKDIYTMIDPTLLLDAEAYADWETTEFLEKEKYVCAYFVTESRELMACAQKVADVMGIKLIELHCYKRPEFEDHYQIAHIGPAQFLWYIKHAEFVVSNSFHGTAFSILYEKPFYAVYINGKNQRIQNLLAALELTHRHIETTDNIDIMDVVDYENVKILLEKQRKEAEKFLNVALGQSHR